MGSDYRSGTSLNYANHTDPIFTAPPGIVNGDVLGLLFEIGGNPTPPTPTPPSGFTIAAGYPLTRSDSNGFTVKTYLWTKPANNEVGDYQVLHSSAVSTGFLWSVLGADAANPLTPAPTTQTGLGTTATAPGLTTTLDQTLIMGWVGRWNFPGGTFDAGGTTPSFTLRNDAANSLLYVASGVKSPQGATGDKVMTGLPQAGNEPWAGGLIAFKPAAAGTVQQMAGVSGGRCSMQGALSVIRGFDGRTGGEAGTRGVLVVLRALAGRVAGSSTAQASFTALRRFAGMAQGIGRAIGSLFLSSEFTSPFTIDDQTFAASWEDDQTIDGASWEDNQTFALADFGTMKTGAKIKPKAIGDDFRVRRTYTSLPTGNTLTKAWFSVKKSEKDDDLAALIFKEVTIAQTSAGQITDNDTTGGSVAMYFNPNASETINAKAGLDYLYDVKVLLSNGEIHTMEQGTIPFVKRRTQKTS